jgi:hypothetical protein
MAKILCAYSGITFQVEHFPISLTQRESYHPIFDVPQKKLLPYLRKWGANELTPTDSYLLFLSLLKSSDLVDFRYPTIRTENTDSIVAQHMENLAKVVIKINTVTSPAQVFPSYVINPDTRNLENVDIWIDNWKDSYEDFCNGARRDYDNRRVGDKERVLQRLIMNPHREITSYATQLAEWASLAGKFPKFTTNSPFSGKPISCDEYWKQLIVKCINGAFLTEQMRADVKELLDHCEDNIHMVGSIYSKTLFSNIWKALEKSKNFLELGDRDIAKSTYHILESSDQVEELNIKAIIDSAPETMPTREQYPSKFEYLRAKMRYETAQSYKKKELTSWEDKVTHPQQREGDSNV